MKKAKGDNFFVKVSLFSFYLLKECFKFIVNSEQENENNYQRKDICKINSHPVFNFKTFTGICLCHVIFPAPAFFADTEKKIYKGTKRKKDVTYKEVFKIHYCSAEY